MPSLRVPSLRRSAVALAGLVLLLGCKRSVDEHAVEETLKSALAKGGLSVTSVTCPPGIPATQTTPFQCTAAQAAGDPIVANVTSKGEGGLDYDFANVVDESAVTEVLEPKIKTAWSLDVDIQCPKKFRVVKNGDSFHCPASVAGKMETMDCDVSAGTHVDCLLHNLVNEKKVTDAIEPNFKAKGVLADIQCSPTTYIVAHAGVKFSCPAKVDGKDETADCAFTNETGSFDCNLH